jgi:hypothetical protein
MRGICWLISLAFLLLWGFARVMHPDNMDFPHDFFLLKYAADIAILNLVILMFAYPYLLSNGLIVSNYNESNEVEKAKSILVIYSIFLPGITLVCISGILAEITPFYFIAAVYCAFYLKNAYIYFSKRTG